MPPTHLKVKSDPDAAHVEQQLSEGHSNDSTQTTASSDPRGDADIVHVVGDIVDVRLLLIVHVRIFFN